MRHALVTLALAAASLLCVSRPAPAMHRSIGRLGASTLVDQQWWHAGA